jgi:hypothetical protein
MVPSGAMKILPFLLATIVAFASLTAHASTPKKQPLVKYTGLWTNSPFTSKPIVEVSAPAVNPFEDFTLTGIAPVPGGYRITIHSKKNPEIKKLIEPGGSDEFKVVSVDRNPEKALGTTVVLSSGSIRGTVTFEPELVTLKPAPAAPVARQGNQNLPPGLNIPPTTNQNPGGQADLRQPRPRVVPPQAPPINTQQQQNQSAGDRRRPPTR